VIKAPNFRIYIFIKGSIQGSSANTSSQAFLLYHRAERGCAGSQKSEANTRFPFYHPHETPFAFLPIITTTLLSNAILFIRLSRTIVLLGCQFSMPSSDHPLQASLYHWREPEDLIHVKSLHPPDRPSLE